MDAFHHPFAWGYLLARITTFLLALNVVILAATRTPQPYGLPFLLIGAAMLTLCLWFMGRLHKRKP
jgi:hypothetical protein